MPWRLCAASIPDPKDAGEVSHFQALATALSGTVGLGNIAGVAVAVSIGGAGATFWMILAGILGMATKFTECTLGVKYRNEYPDGTVSGGPMYYLEKRVPRARLALGQVHGGVVFHLLRVGRIGGRQHVSGQPSRKPGAKRAGRARLGDGAGAGGHRVRRDYRRHQIHRAGHGKGRALHGRGLRGWSGC